MIGLWAPARQFPSQPSLLVISLTERTARVCLPPRSRLRWHASKSPLSFPCLSLAFNSLPLPSRSHGQCQHWQDVSDSIESP
jgi:hypothetical protein